MSTATGAFGDRITIDPEICHGKPCIRGMRYPVEVMLEYLAGGDSIEEVLREFPDLERDDLLACLEFARKTLAARGESGEASSRATLVRGEFGRAVLIAPAGAPPMTTERIKAILDERNDW
jgi:uncharacterized protein (DUF433 family)